jgi:hypothetical protein
MTYTMQSPTTTVMRPPRRVPTSGLGLRLRLLGRAAVHSLTALLGLALFPLWLTLVAVSPLTIIAWLVLPATGLVRAYADAHRQATGTLLGAPIARPYRATGGSWLHRVWRIVRDPASWRDAAWLLVHAVIGFSVAVVQVFLFLGTAFYLIYPFLFWVTPAPVFRQPFGFFTLHSVAQAALLEPLAVAAFALWWFTAIPLSRIEASLTRALLR